jgi:hypothetical protein
MRRAGSKPDRDLHGFLKANPESKNREFRVGTSATHNGFTSSWASDQFVLPETRLNNNLKPKKWRIEDEKLQSNPGFLT